ncbi:3-oxoadipate enol-lactonase [Nitrospirillum sp. BR 11164]|uniref:3-oxoadipate enol-lactonase n=1 Tax=Nitrospirillum sp. BR 11164 TaxID=3104324 RepID=UPI002AFDD309|nr:3-oxoadipate enol-lactonase [Nitrospirillum sp. BR 11164]MEA1647903.1 3-oxoadipate enol-lactonase [Nitrospirillum sp. BR 11164]
MPLITLDDGCHLSYRVDGPADAPPLVLSNSLGTAMAMWEPQMAALAQHYRVIRYDSRGHGSSDAPAGPYTMERLGQDVLGLLDELDIYRVRFCGLSKGGMVGQWLGINAGQRLDRLVLANTAAYMGPAESWQGRMDLVAAQGMAAVTEAVIQRWFTPGFVAAQPDAVDRVRRLLLATKPQGYVGCCAAIRDMDQRPQLPVIAVPTLVIGGTQDPATPPEKARELHANIKGSTLMMLEAAHLSNVEQAHAFTAAVIDFLA